MQDTTTFWKYHRSNPHGKNDIQQLKMNNCFLVVAVVSVICILIMAINITGIQRVVRVPMRDLTFEKPDNKSKTSSYTYHDPWKNTNRSLTVVTAFFDLGKFPKGSFSNMRTPDSYKNWMEVYKYLQNPLIIYTDSKELAKYFENLRQNSTYITKVITFSREQLWPFQILPKISKIYSKPGYPKHYPNTYIPEYTGMTHSKLPLVVKAIKAKSFPSDFYCWIDFGYFRELAGRKKQFYLEIPGNFDNSKVGVTRVYNSDLENKTAKSIILGNQNWIGGGLFLGKPEVLTKFELQYKNRVLYYLSQGLMNVEQHILYSMYTKKERKKRPITVEVQLYVPGTQKVIAGDPWFYLGYLMYHEIHVNTTTIGVR